MIPRLIMLILILDVKGGSETARTWSLRLTTLQRLPGERDHVRLVAMASDPTAAARRARPCEVGRYGKRPYNGEAAAYFATITLRLLLLPAAVNLIK